MTYRLLTWDRLFAVVVTKSTRWRLSMKTRLKVCISFNHAVEKESPQPNKKKIVFIHLLFRTLIFFGEIEIKPIKQI